MIPNYCSAISSLNHSAVDVLWNSWINDLRIQVFLFSVHNLPPSSTLSIHPAGNNPILQPPGILTWQPSAPLCSLAFALQGCKDAWMGVCLSRCVTAHVVLSSVQCAHAHWTLDRMKHTIHLYVLYANIQYMHQHSLYRHFCASFPFSVVYWFLNYCTFYSNTFIWQLQC